MDLTLKEIIKFICMLLVLFCYLGGFAVWSFVILLISDYFDERKNNRKW